MLRRDDEPVLKTPAGYTKSVLLYRHDCEGSMRGQELFDDSPIRGWRLDPVSGTLAEVHDDTQRGIPTRSNYKGRSLGGFDHQNEPDLIPFEPSYRTNPRWEHRKKSNPYNVLSREKAEKNSFGTVGYVSMWLNSEPRQTPKSTLYDEFPIREDI